MKIQSKDLQRTWIYTTYYDEPESVLLRIDTDDRETNDAFHVLWASGRIYFYLDGVIVEDTYTDWAESTSYLWSKKC